MNINDLLKIAVERKASDLHLKVGSHPVIRVDGELIGLADLKRLLQEDTIAMAFSIMNARQKQRFKEEYELDIAYSVPGLGRFRCNVFQQRGAVGMVLRVIPARIQTMRELMLPPVLEKICEERRGLILCTGTTGSGKSTTLAAMLDSINAGRSEHIMTIEDPIEFLHRDKKSIVNQREIDVDTRAFSPALRAALRQDPDVILVGEMRDYETISLALTAAEMGALVFGTLHTNGAAKTIDRVIDAFPADEQPQARLSLSESLAGVVSQQLLKTADGKGRCATNEILIRTSGLANVIREGNTPMLLNIIQSGKSQGMQTMDDALMALVQANKIVPEDAYRKAIDKARFEKYAPAD